ncbi:MAG: 50S ribosomal protein L23 [Candidatus Nucleicultricaceae bacterium]
MSKKDKNTPSVDLTKAYDVIKSPIITEKATIASQDRQFVFFVCPNATKTDIKEAVEAIFKVKVNAVNTLNVKGKTKRFKGFLGRRSDRKKAYVSLKEGHTIDIGASL